MLLSAVIQPMDAIAAAATVGNKSQVVIDVLKAHFNPVLEDEVGQCGDS